MAAVESPQKSPWALADPAGRFGPDVPPELVIELKELFAAPQPAPG